MKVGQIQYKVFTAFIGYTLAVCFFCPEQTSQLEYTYECSDLSCTAAVECSLNTASTHKYIMIFKNSSIAPGLPASQESRKAY